MELRLFFLRIDSPSKENLKLISNVFLSKNNLDKYIKRFKKRKMDKQIIEQLCSMIGHNINFNINKESWMMLILKHPYLLNYYKHFWKIEKRFNIPNSYNNFMNKLFELNFNSDNNELNALAGIYKLSNLEFQDYVEIIKVYKSKDIDILTIESDYNIRELKGIENLFAGFISNTCAGIHKDASSVIIESYTNSRCTNLIIESKSIRGSLFLIEYTDYFIIDSINVLPDIDYTKLVKTIIDLSKYLSKSLRITDQEPVANKIVDQFINMNYIIHKHNFTREFEHTDVDTYVWSFKENI